MPRKANPTDVHVGLRVKMRRMMLGMSQEELGNALDLTFQQIQKYEKGANRIGAGRLHSIANILSVPVSYFFQGVDAGKQHADRNGETDTLTKVLSTPEGIRIARMLSRIRAPETRRCVADLLESVLTLKERKATM